MFGGEHRRAFLLLGPRQVGKTVLFKQLARRAIEEGWPAGNVLYVNFSDALVNARFKIEISDLATVEPPGFVPAHPLLLLLDEIHRAPTWPFWLKRTVDEQAMQQSPRLRILVTDSSASILRQATIESGVGRWDERRIHGLSFGEFVEFHTLDGETAEQALIRSPGLFEDYLAKGGLPAHAHRVPSAELRTQIREDVVERTLRRDLLAQDERAEQRLDVDQVARLFTILVQNSGDEWSREDRASDLGAHASSVTNWLKMLEDACLVHRVERHLPGQGVPAASRRAAAKPKIFAFDHGLIVAFTQDLYPLDHRVRGRVFEAVVLRHLLELVESRSDVGYFKYREGREIDFVVRLQGRLHAIEVTSGQDLAQKAERLARMAGDIGAPHATLIHDGLSDGSSSSVRWLSIRRFLLDPDSLIEGLP